MRVAQLLLMLPLVLLLALRGQGAGAAEQLPPLPPLTDPPTGMQVPGKFVWADIFSNDIETTRRFYQDLLGWEWRWISDPTEPYGIFSASGNDVAGLAYRDVEGDGPYARWVHYLSVADVGKAETLINELGGRMLMRHKVADRGDFAIFVIPDGILLGVLRSSSGDPEDAQSLEGEWIWHQLYTWSNDESEAALRKLVPEYQSEVASEYDEIDRLLGSGGYLRAGLLELPANSEEAPTWIGFVRVTDVSSVTSRVAGLGGKVHYSAPSGDMAIIADPLGALIGVLEYTYPKEDTQ